MMMYSLSSNNSHNHHNNNDISNFLSFPSPLMQYGDELFLSPDLPNLDIQHHHQSLLNVEHPVAHVPHMVGDPHDHQSREVPAGRKGSKKDRHSKINTAHGPRDRRMRLSLDVARRFFDLQDMLGFDKASKTVEWLLNQSRAAIRELSGGGGSAVGGGTNSASSTSECEVISGVVVDEPATIKNRGKKRSSCTKEKKKKKVKAKPRRIPYPPLAKESRERARERARERTREKRRLDEEKKRLHFNHGSWSSIETGEGGDEVNRHPVGGGGGGGGGHEVVNDDPMVVSGNWSPIAPPFNIQFSAGICTAGPQYVEFQFNSKSSEDYSSNMNLCG